MSGLLNYPPNEKRYPNTALLIKLLKNFARNSDCFNLFLLKEYPSEDYRAIIEPTEIMDTLGEKIHFNEVARITDFLTPEKLLLQCNKNRKSDLYHTDKGYLSEDIPKLIHETLNAYAIIPVFIRKRKRISGYYRRRRGRSLEDDTYHQRDKYEKVFSVLKRTEGNVARLENPVNRE